MATDACIWPPTHALLRLRGRESVCPGSESRDSTDVLCSDGFDSGGDQVVGDVGAGDPLADQGSSLVFWLYPNVDKPSILQRTRQFSQKRRPDRLYSAHALPATPRRVPTRIPRCRGGCCQA